MGMGCEVTMLPVLRAGVRVVVEEWGLRHWWGGVVYVVHLDYRVCNPLACVKQAIMAVKGIEALTSVVFFLRSIVAFNASK